MGYVSAVPKATWLRRVATLTACALVGGGLLHVMAFGWVPGTWQRAAFGAYLGLVMWHFVLDAGIWRLREPFQRQYMTERFSCRRP